MIIILRCYFLIEILIPTIVMNFLKNSYQFSFWFLCLCQCGLVFQFILVQPFSFLLWIPFSSDNAAGRTINSRENVLACSSQTAFHLRTIFSLFGPISSLCFLCWLLWIVVMMFFLVVGKYPSSHFSMTRPNILGLHLRGICFCQCWLVYNQVFC